MKKQFPEKWAVRGSQEFKSFAKRQGIRQNEWLGDGLYTYYHLINNEVCGYNETIPDGYTEVTLEDLIAHYEPTKKVVKCKDNWLSVLALTVDKEYVVESETSNYFRIADDREIFGDYAKARFIDSTTHPKWMPLTKGGLEVHINEEFEGKLFGRIKHEDNKWSSNCWYLNGNDFYEYSERNLIPYNPRIAELEEKITSKRSELAELEGELNTLKREIV